MKRKNFLKNISLKSAAVIVASFAVIFAAQLLLAAAAGVRKADLPPPSSSAASPVSVAAADTQARTESHPAEYIEAIYSALKNNSSDVRLRALEIIRERPALFVSARVKPLLEDKDINVKIQTVRAMAALNDRAGVPYLRSLAFTSPKLSAAPTVSERVKIFTAQNNRIKAIVALGDIKDTISTERLEAATKDGDARVADAAWIALAAMGNKRGAEIFIDGLKNSEKAVRAKSSEVVGDIGAVDGLAALRERAGDWDKDVKLNAIRSLGVLRDVKSAPRLREIVVTDKDQSIRESAVRALGEIRDGASAAFLKNYISDENIVVRLAVCESLAKMNDYSGKEFVKALAERAVEKEARYRALRALSHFSLDTADENLLREIVSDDDPMTALEAVRVLAFKKAGLSGED